jgi:hypothetical protein
MMPCAWEVAVPAELCSGWEDYSQTTKDSALWLASTWLWAATGRQYGVCPVSVRPSQSLRGGEILYQSFPVAPGLGGLGEPGGPFLFGGRWFNSGCASACCGNSACAIVLRGPVAEVYAVWVGEEEIPESSYRVDVAGGVYLLVRLDGECWPTCQTMVAAPGEPGSFEVTYGLGRPVPEALAIATAQLACEYGSLITGGACKLPARMTQLTRQGVTVEVEPPGPGEGLTGLPMVDNIVSILNPGGRKSPPLLLSPDLPESCDRMTVWVGGS